MATALKDTTRIEGHAACNWPTLEVVSDAVRDARNAVANARDVAKHAADRFELEARRRPVAAAGVAAAAGFIAGGVLAFGLGWFAARRFGR
jgi:ElaB/YqjD/DUF883 family membrane-anchored ribosome-binding protein